MVYVSDADIRARLKELDESDHEVSSWEAAFIESVLFRQTGSLTDSQRNKALQILDDYGS